MVARAVRNIDTVPGIGGQLRISNASNNIVGGVSYPDGGTNFEISKWEIYHEYKNVDVTHSGSNGAKKYKRVSVDFRFKAEIPFDIGQPLGQFPELAFLPGWAMSSDTGEVLRDSSIQITFRCGDSAFYNPGTYQYYHCPEVLLNKCDIICDSTGEDILRVIVEGQGSGLLAGWEGAAHVFGA